MKGNNKIIKSILTVYVVAVLGIVIFNLIEPFLYNKATSGKKTTIKLYDVAHAIIAKKYELILYEKSENLFTIFSYNCKKNLSKLENSSFEKKLIDSFVSFQITNIEEKGNIYIVYYNEQFADSSINENKMIIKYKNSKAIIYYDSILEGDYD